MCDTNKAKLVNQKEKYLIELDHVRNKLEKAHSVAMDAVDNKHRKIVNQKIKKHLRALAAVHKQSREDSQLNLAVEENLKSTIETMKQNLKTLRFEARENKKAL